MSVDEPNVASPILVTGTTGRHGGTGRAVASLISKGFRTAPYFKRWPQRDGEWPRDSLTLMIASTLLMIGIGSATMLQCGIGLY
jgi:hypothetical protein